MLPAAGVLDANGHAPVPPTIALTQLGNLLPLLGTRICANGVLLPGGMFATNPVERTFR